MPNELDEQARGLDRGRGRIVKMHFVGKDEKLSDALLKADNGVQASNVMHGVDEAERRFSMAGAIEPPYNPATLAALLEHSNSLRQNVDAYATNIDGFGHRFEPTLDLEAPDADQRIAQAIAVERQSQLSENPGLSLSPTPEEVQVRKQKMVEQMRLEHSTLAQFFENCTDDISFVALRRKVRQDLEVIGNGYIEVLRNGSGRIAEFTYVPGFTIRLLPLDQAPTKVRVKQRVGEMQYATVDKTKHLRKFVQVFESFLVYFKEFGDPRVISKMNGQVFLSVDELLRANPNDAPATELLHFRIHSSRTAYGVPRWIGNLLSVLGSRQAEEVNFLYFENKSVPPLALLVSGGRVSEDTVARLESYIDTEIKGKKNFHKMLIVEAESGGEDGKSGKVKIELKPLTDAQNSDALFQNYDEKNIDKIGMAFRLPRMLRGDIRDFNRASAEAALDFAEQQVFSPEREDFDFLVNKRILSELGIVFWRYRSNAPALRDPQVLAEIIEKLTVANVLTPEEARELCAGVFNRSLAKIRAPWTKQPTALTLAGVTPPVDDTNAPWTGGEDRIGEDSAAYNDRDADGQPDAEQKGTAPGGGGLVTRTALGNVVTVNEARAAHGLGPRQLADGSVDPLGELTIAEYMSRAEAQRQQMGLPPSAGQPQHQQRPALKGDGEGALSNNSTPYDSSGQLTITDLKTQGGGLQPAQGRRMRRLPATARGASPEAALKALQARAGELLGLRDALLDAEATHAASDFYARKRAELATAEIRLPDDVVRDIMRAEKADAGDGTPPDA
jgi:PBSX family phage portal protein